MPKYNMPYCDEGSSPAGWRAPEPAVPVPVLYYISAQDPDEISLDLFVWANDPLDAIQQWQKHWMDELSDGDEWLHEYADGPDIWLVPTTGVRGPLPWEKMTRYDAPKSFFDPASMGGA